MDCVRCAPKHCRTTKGCGAESFEQADLIAEYGTDETQKIVQAAATLVDGGRAGSLSRLDELIEFSSTMGYRNVGLAYCYGMEREAKLVRERFVRAGVPMSTVSCTVGGMRQNELNRTSTISTVACNPVGQAQQLTAHRVDFVIMMGLCVGHDILLQRNLNVDSTTLVAKDRIHQHAPIKAVLSEPETNA